jgi:hypothetical protein
MKRTLVTCALILFGFASAFSQDNVLKTNPIGLAFGNFNVTYEKVLNNRKASILFSGSYIYEIFSVDVNTVGLGVAYRFYLTNAKKDVPSGLYVNPQIGFSFGSVEDFNYNAFAIGAEIGYQWAWDSGVVLDLGIGPNITILGGDYDNIDFDVDGDNTAVLPSVTIALGYAW